MSTFARVGPGMDQDHYTWSPAPAREPIRWPNGAPVAFAVLMLLEHVELYPPEDSTQTQVAGGVGPFPYPNVPLLAHRDYGARVGVFRLLDLFGDLGIPVSVAIDAMTAERFPRVVAECEARETAFVCHGISASQLVSEAMGEDAERAYIASSRDRVSAAAGRSVDGWLAPEQSESTRSPALLREAGFTYLCDWPNDDQPYEFEGHPGLTSLPTTYGLDDAHTLWSRSMPLAQYEQAVTRYCAGLAAEGRSGGRSLVLPVRPWLVGQPFRVGALEAALRTIIAAGDAWFTTTDEIASAFVAGRQGHQEAG